MNMVQKFTTVILSFIVALSFSPCVFADELYHGENDEVAREYFAYTDEAADLSYSGNIPNTKAKLYVIGKPSKSNINKISMAFRRLPKNVTANTDYVVLYEHKAWVRLQDPENNIAAIANYNGIVVDEYVEYAFLEHLVHESMHNIYFSNYYNYSKFEEDEYLSSVYDKYKNKVGKYSWYAKTDVREFVSECFGFYVFDQDTLKKCCKPMYDWFKENIGTVKIAATSITLNDKTITKKNFEKACKKKMALTNTLTKVTIGGKVKKVSVKSFSKYDLVKKITIKTSKLSKESLKNLLVKNKSVKTVSIDLNGTEANYKCYKKYKKWIKSMKLGRDVKIVWDGDYIVANKDKGDKVNVGQKTKNVKHCGGCVTYNDKLIMLENTK